MAGIDMDDMIYLSSVKVDKPPREIKFRGLDFDGNWQYGFLMELDAEGKTYSWIFNCGNQVAVVRKSVGQFTGLLDKNGREIFEGDVLEYKNETQKHCWVKGSRFKMQWDKHTAGWFGYEPRSSFEVVGSSFEHPELLTQ